MEIMAWTVISQHASLLSPMCEGRPGGIQGVVPFGCEGRPGGIQGVIPFGCEGRPGEVLMSYGFSANSSSKKLKLVRWIPPISHYYLNVDGETKGNPGECGGGGCIRDRKGEVVAAFSHSYGYGNSFIAEVRALCDGIRMVESLGIRISIIYFDSLALVNSMKSGKCPSWQAYLWWREAYSILHKKNFYITHMYREANQVGDGLANFGCLTKENITYWGPGRIPSNCKGPLLLDKTGLPHSSEHEESVDQNCKTRPSWALGPVLRVAADTLVATWSCEGSLSRQLRDTAHLTVVSWSRRGWASHSCRNV
ncbi:hypothetical protein Taro_054693 [Colocasia esculenta]|uniref:RNase H type-1 domain-containing protein n=1 Tax=Colocasia esculenta TaxID=4460 RepID=A0A843XPJ2_COLES|nr:hypothetical protein [Colocasia esculenta]